MKLVSPNSKTKLMFVSTQVSAEQCDIADQVKQRNCGQIFEVTDTLEHEFQSLHLSNNENTTANSPVNSDIVHISSNKTETQRATDDALLFMDGFTKSIVDLNLSEKNTNAIFRLCGTLVNNLKNLAVRMNNDDNQMTPSHIIESSTNLFLDQLTKRNSTFKRNKQLSSSCFYVPPREIAIGTRWELKKVIDHQGDKNSIEQIIQNTYQYVSPVETIESLFKNEEFRNCYLKNNTVLDHTCESGRYKHFCCGSTYKNSAFFRENPLALQIHLASDDFEICSPLQSKAGVHKICAIYFTIRNLPTRHLSKLNNIYIVALCNANDLKSKTTDFNNLWQQIVFDLKYLEQFGIDVIGHGKLKGTLTHLSFDNLGANFSLGFPACFVSSHYCRHCMRSKDECQTICSDDGHCKRSKNDYAKQLKIVEQSEKVDFNETKGVKMYCKLNDLDYFHILDNPTVDPMHDLLEGCIPFLLKKVFTRCIEKRIFSESDLNWMIQFHKFGKLDRCNIPSSLELNKRSLGQNASQMLCLFRNLPFILSEYSEHIEIKAIWRSITSLLRITEIALAQIVTEIELSILKREVMIHLNSIILTFKEHLRPKHHFLLHYEAIIRVMGPLIALTMMRFEAKHQQIKKMVGDNKNFRNINKTLAIKHQKMLSSNIFCDKDVIETLKLSSVTPQFILDHVALLNQNNIDSESLLKTDLLRVNNCEYFPGLFFIHDFLLYEICYVLMSHDKYYLLAKEMEIGNFNEFLNCFEIKAKIVTDFMIINQQEIKNAKTFESKMFKNKVYVVAATLDLNKTNIWK